MRESGKYQRQERRKKIRRRLDLVESEREKIEMKRMEKLVRERERVRNRERKKERERIFGKRGSLNISSLSSSR